VSETPTTVEVEDDLGVWERPFPRVVRIEPAGACNLACSHCPTGTVKMSRGIMRAETFARILESVRAHLDAVKVVVMYHGGEPLLNKGFAGMVRQIKAAGVPFVKTVSNGMLLDERVISGLVASGLDALEVSLDGESAAQNDFVRRNVDAATVVGNLQRHPLQARAGEQPSRDLHLHHPVLAARGLRHSP
jgi:MoaA/NifB/PqqE/SkfB family radical SAM enzyme